jgi:hypothetical protein
VHEGFENLVEPWSRIVRDSCPPPHAWAAAKTALFIRNMMVREFGGERGIEPGKRNLYLFSLVSPAWVEPGRRLEIHNAITEMGHISAAMVFTDDGADVDIKPDFSDNPANLVLTVPWFVDFKSADSDKCSPAVRNGRIFLKPEEQHVVLHWKIKAGVFAGTYQRLFKMYRSEYGFVGKYPQAEDAYSNKKLLMPILSDAEESHTAVPLSFKVVREAFTHEYALRFRKFISEGDDVELARPPFIRK